MRLIIIILCSTGLLVFIAYLFYQQKLNPPPPAELDTIPRLSTTSGRYPELLKEAVHLELARADNTVHVRLTNKHPDITIPSEEPHRAIVCTTEIFDDHNQRLGSYPEYFKPVPASLWGKTPTTQIKPLQTVHLTYTLAVPHGLIRTRVTYEDLSRQFQSASPTGGFDIKTLLLAEQTLEF